MYVMEDEPVLVLFFLPFFTKDRRLRPIDNLAVFYISIEFWGILICLIALIIIAFGKSKIFEDRHIKISMQIACILLLVNDSLAWIFRGQSGQLASRMVHISNFCVYAVNYIYLSIFSVFLWKRLKNPNEKFPKRIYTTFALSSIGVILLIISQVKPLFYYFDANNCYHRGQLYIIAQILPLISMVLLLSLLFQHRKRLERPVFFAMLACFIFPCIATLIMVFFYGVALQNLALVISTQFLFVVDMLDISQKLTKSEAALLKANFAAQHDPMNGLLNKPTAMNLIDQYLLSMEPEDTAALLFIDIDNFKSINDHYGHTTGDYWIREVANILVTNCRKEDIVCRFGGDEFLILMKGTADTEVLEDKMNQLIHYTRHRSSESGQDVHCSIGICRINGRQYTTDRCLELADAALYEAKENGKNTYVIY